jgi:hypothetical protein
MSSSREHVLPVSKNARDITEKRDTVIPPQSVYVAARAALHSKYGNSEQSKPLRMTSAIPIISAIDVHGAAARIASFARQYRFEEGDNLSYGATTETDAVGRGDDVVCSSRS